MDESSVQKEQPQAQAAATPSPRPAVQSVYPQPAEHHWQAVTDGVKDAKAEQYRQAAMDLNELITLVAGVASSTAYFLILYWVKNTIVMAIVCVALAACSIFFAFKNYRSTGRIGPLTVIGLSAATITLVYIANALIASAVIRAATNGLYR